MKLTMTGGPELERALRELGGQVAGRLGQNAVNAGARAIAADVPEAVRRCGRGSSSDRMRPVNRAPRYPAPPDSAGSKARHATAVRFAAFSFIRMRRTKTLTVFSVMLSSCAMILFGLP
jgi:hypothetical protein